eukprot:IDg3648t1
MPTGHGNGGIIRRRGAGQNCIRFDALPIGSSAFIQQGPLPSVQDANKKPLTTMGILALYVQAGSTIIRTDFLVCKNLSVLLIIGSAFIDRNVGSIDIENQKVIFLDGSHTPVVRRWRQPIAATTQ